MRKTAAVVVMLGLSCLVGAASGYGAETKEFGAIIQESVTITNQLADLLVSVKDRPSADKVLPKVKKIVARVKELSAKLEKLGPPTPEQEEELKKKYEKSANAAEDKMVREAIRLSETEYGKALVKEL